MISAAADTRTTIIAIASSTAPALRGIVRLSGDDAVAVFAAMAIDFQPPSGSRPYRVSVRLELGPPLGELPVAALVWPTKRSYTGSPSVEIHTFGSVPLLEAIVAAAVRAGARPAGPGEFTMRAFLAGRIDLTQAEAVLGVIDATDREQLDAALDQLAGNVSRPLQAVRNRLLDLLADVEAGLDFVDEDIHFIDDDAISRELAAAASVIAETRTQMAGRHRASATADIVLRGLPNIGKSSLLNALVGRPIAIVSDEAGTTRDVVWHELEIEGRPVRLLDTAGQEEPTDEITRASQTLGRESERSAAVTLACVDGSVARELDPARLRPAEQASASGWLPVATRCDRVANPERLAAAGWIVTSTLGRSPVADAGCADAGAEIARDKGEQSVQNLGEGTGCLGLEDLRRRIAAELDRQTGLAERGVSATAARCADAIERAERAIATAAESVAMGAGHEWVAGEIRVALAAIGEITGEIHTDDLLDRVFSRFCIGK